MQTHLATANRQHVIAVLNSFLRGEIAAVETYRQALVKLRNASFGSVLHDNMRSHEQRMQLLIDEIRRQGGVPSEGSGPWGVMAKAIESGAMALGEKATLQALEEGEDHGRNDYQRDLDKLDPTTREFVRSKLLAEQLRTHDAMSQLKKSLS